MTMQKPLIIFDIDGTLTDTVKIDDLCFVQTIKDLYSFDLGNVDWNVFPHATDWGICKTVFEKILKKDLTRKDLSKTKEHFLRLLSNSFNSDPQLFREIPGSVDFFRHLKEENYPVAIATGGWSETASFKLSKVQIETHNIPFANSNHFFSRKRIIEKAINMSSRLHDVNFSNAVYFGDGKWDLAASKELGIQFVGIDSTRNGLLKKHGAKSVFNDFLETERILAEIKKTIHEI